MLVDWSVECAADDPVLVVPWNDPSGNAAFVDLRANPYDFDAVPEAEQYLPLMQLLRVLNANRSPVFTAKCDVWILQPEELDHLQFSLGLTDVPQTGVGSYIDIVWRDAAAFRSFHQHEHQLARLVRLAATFECESAELEFILRPAVIDFDGPQEGYAVTAYVKAIGEDELMAMQEWAIALDALGELIRGRPAAASRLVS